MASKKLIFLIDDHEPTLDLAKDILQEKGFVVQAFRHFEEAAPSLKESSPALIISDLIGHTESNGVQFFIEHVWHRDIPFALLTGSLNEQEIRKRFGIGLLLQSTSERAAHQATQKMTHPMANGAHSTAYGNGGARHGIRVSFDQEKAASQEQVDMTVEDLNTGRKTTFRVFPKPFASLDAILSYYGL